MFDDLKVRLSTNFRLIQPRNTESKGFASPEVERSQFKERLQLLESLLNTDPFKALKVKVVIKGRKQQMVQPRLGIIRPLVLEWIALEISSGRRMFQKLKFRKGLQLKGYCWLNALVSLIMVVSCSAIQMGPTGSRLRGLVKDVYKTANLHLPRDSSDTAC